MSEKIVDVGELEALVEACADGFQAELREDGATRGFANKLLAHAEFVTRREHGALLGCVAYYCNDTATLTAFITLVAVAPQARGRGLARVMVAQMLAGAGGRGFKQVRLRVLRRNVAAIALYHAMDFVITDESPRDYEMTINLDAIAEIQMTGVTACSAPE